MSRGENRRSLIFVTETAAPNLKSSSGLTLPCKVSVRCSVSAPVSRQRWFPQPPRVLTMPPLASVRTPPNWERRRPAPLLSC